METAEITVIATRAHLDQWRTAARAAGMSLNEWLVAAIQLAAESDLPGGAKRLPSITGGLDPLLARGIREAAAGKPWERRALLLLEGAERAEAPSELSAKVTPRTSDRAQDLMHAIGLPLGQFPPHEIHARFGDVPLTWLQAALLAFLHRAERDGVAVASQPGLADALGRDHRDLGSAMGQLRLRGLVDRRDHNGGRTLSEYRIADRIRSALDRGDVRRIDPVERLALESRERVRAEIRPRSKGDPDIKYARRVVPRDHPMRAAMVRLVAEERRRMRERTG